MAKPLDILGAFQDPNNLDQGASKLVNVRMVPRQAEEGKPGRARLVGAPGLTQVSVPSTKPCIALCHALGNIWSAHADGSVYYGVETATPTLAGFVAVNATTPIIRLAEDRTALAIASNANTNGPTLAGTGYTATQTAGVVNAGFDASINFDPSAVTELDNMTIWSGASNFYSNQNSKMYRSEALQPANVQPNSFATKEARADAVADLALSGRFFWPLGVRSLEQWYDAGDNTDFPFTPFPNSLNSVGIAGRQSLAILRDVMAFVATDRRIWTCTGQAGQAVSPPWVDLLLQQLTTTQLTQLVGYAYGQGGSDFYVLTLPGAWSIELAAATMTWSYRQSPGSLDHGGRCAAEHDGGVTYIGMDTGQICTLNLNSATEPTGTLSRVIITPWVGAQDARQTYDSLDITSSMGPQAGNFQLDWSETADVTVNGVLVSSRAWRAPRQIQMPQPGVKRAIAREFGTGRRRQFRIQYSGTQAPFEIDELFATVSPGT